MDRTLTRKQIHFMNPAILFALFGLYLTSYYSFLLFHSLAEFFSILVAFSIFTISWNARRHLNGSYLILLGISYLCVGSIDILHTIAFKGMGIFTTFDTNLPTQLWIAARYLEALSLFAVPLFIKKKINPERTLAIYLALSLVLIVLIFSRVFPDCYIEGVGLTPFKIISEYVICAVLLITILLMARKRSAFEPSIFSLLIASIVVRVATELSFTSYINVYGYEQVIGHILKLLSFYLIYRAIVVTSITNPFDSLFWELNQSKERLRLFIEHAPASLAMFDRNMRYLSVSRRWLSDFDLGDRDLIGISHYEVFPEVSDNWKKAYQRGLAGEVVRVDDDRLVRADGSEQWVRWEVRPWPDAAGEIAGIVIFTEDITHRKEAEEKLSRLASFPMVNPQPIVEANLEGQVVFLNPSAQQMFPDIEEKGNNHPWLADWRSVVPASQEDGENVSTCEVRIGERFFLQTRHYLPEAGRIRIYGTDITDRKKLEKELKRSRDELEIRVRERTAELSESKTQLQFLAAQLLTAQENERRRIALEVHDVLGSSLSAIKFKVEDVLQRIDQGTTPKISELLESIIPLIRDTIGEAKRIQTDLRPPLLDDLGIIATFSWYCRRFHTIYSDIQVEQEVTIQEDEVPEYLKIALFRITQEAMNNIAKYSKADLVRLGLRKVNGTIGLTIQDNGEGFDTESLSSRDSSKKGLGLSSMKERTEILGGSFIIESKKGKGTVIKAVWPI